MSVKVGIELSGLTPDFFTKMSRSAVEEFGKVTQASIDSDKKRISNAKITARTEEELVKKQAEVRQALLAKQWEAERQLGANVGALRAKHLAQITALEKKQGEDIIAFRKGLGISLESITAKRIEAETAAHRMGFKVLEKEYDTHSKRVVDLTEQLSKTRNTLKREEIQNEIAEEKRATAILRKEYTMRDEVRMRGAGAGRGILGIGRNLASSTAMSNALAVTGGAFSFAEIVKMGDESIRLESQLRGAFRTAGASAQEAGRYVRQATEDYEAYGKALGITEDHYRELSRIAAFTGHFLGEQNKQLVIAAAAIEKQTAGTEGEITADRFIRGISQGMFSDEGKETFGRLKMSMPAFVKDLEGATDKEDLFRRAIAGTNEQVEAQRKFIESTEGTLERETVRRTNQMNRLGGLVVKWIGDIGSWAEEADIKLDRLFGTVTKDEHADVIRQLNEEIKNLEAQKKQFNVHSESEQIKDIDRFIEKKKEQIAGYQKETEAAHAAAKGVDAHSEALDKDTIAAQRAKAANDDFKDSMDKQRGKVTDLVDEATRLSIKLKDPAFASWDKVFGGENAKRLGELPGLIKAAGVPLAEFNKEHEKYTQYDPSQKTTGGGTGESKLKKEFEDRKKVIEAALKDEERDSITARAFGIISEDEANRRMLLSRVNAYRQMASIAAENKYKGMISPEEEAEANLNSAQALEEYTKHREEQLKKSTDKQKEIVKKSYEEDASEQELFYKKKLLTIEDFESRLFVSKEQADVKRAQEEEKYWESVLLIAQSYGVPLIEILTKIEEAKTHVAQAQKALRDKQTKDDYDKEKELAKARKEQFGEYENLTRSTFGGAFMSYYEQWDKPFRDSMHAQMGIVGDFFANFSRGIAGILAGKAAKGIADLIFPPEKEAPKKNIASSAADMLGALRMFDMGGYTGDGDPTEIAGLVHKGEWVIPPNIVKQIRNGNGGNVTVGPQRFDSGTGDSYAIGAPLPPPRKRDIDRELRQRQAIDNRYLSGLDPFRDKDEYRNTALDATAIGQVLDIGNYDRNRINQYTGSNNELIAKGGEIRDERAKESVVKAMENYASIVAVGSEELESIFHAHTTPIVESMTSHGSTHLGLGLGAIAAEQFVTGKANADESKGAPGFTDADVTKTQQNAVKTVGIAADMMSKIKKGNPEQAVSSGIGAVISAINPIAGGIFSGLSSLLGFSHGGLVPRYYASGGIFKPKGTDTVPAMLTPGERVLTDRQNTELNKGFAQMSAASQMAVSAQASNSRVESLLESINGELRNRQYVTSREVRYNNVQDKYVTSRLKL